MPNRQDEAAIQFALNQLERYLSPDLTYHDYWHTAQGVMAAVVTLAALENVSDYEKKLLRVAAAYHDIGFLDTYRDHEGAGIVRMREALPQFGFSQSEINAIAGMILATRLPQSPKNRLEAILADADLDVLGRDDFFARNEKLRLELARFSKAFKKHDWTENQYQFLREHRYFTNGAVERREEGKQTNLRHLKCILESQK